MLSDEQLYRAFTSGWDSVDAGVPGFIRGLRAVEAVVRADQIEKDAEVAEWRYPLGSLVLGDAPSQIAAAIRARLPNDE